MQYAIVYNPSSGAGEGNLKAVDLAARLRGLGQDVALIQTDRDRDVFQELPADLAAVVVVGGDGTLHQAANALAGTSTPLAFLPAGTVNVMALELGLPFDAAGCCDTLRAGRRVDVPLLSIGERRFVLFAELGLVGRLVGFVHRWRSRRPGHGKLEFVLGFLSAAASTWGRTVEVEEEVDGEWRRRQRCSNVLVTRTRRYADRGVVPIDFGERPPLQSASFEVIGCRTTHPLSHALVIGALAAGWMPACEAFLRRLGMIERYHARRVRLRGPGARFVHADAESLAPPVDADGWIRIGDAGVGVQVITPGPSDPG